MKDKIREMRKMNEMTMGLCQGRHEIPGVSEYLFENSVNPLDLQHMYDSVHVKLQYCNALVLYVTGLSVALVTAINYCCENHIRLKLMHYDSNSKSYYCQPVSTQVDYDLLVEAGYYRREK